MIWFSFVLESLHSIRHVQNIVLSAYPVAFIVAVAIANIRILFLLFKFYLFVDYNRYNNIDFMLFS